MYRNPADRAGATNQIRLGSGLDFNLWEDKYG